jgi:membrane protease YdiL (CAAX protease family)
MIAFIGAGVLFAMIYLIFKNLLPAIIVHAGYDLLAIVVQ